MNKYDKFGEIPEKHIITEIKIAELKIAYTNAQSAGLKEFSYRDVVFYTPYAKLIIDHCKNEDKDNIRLYELTGEME